MFHSLRNTVLWTGNALLVLEAEGRRGGFVRHWSASQKSPGFICSVQRRRSARWDLICICIVFGRGTIKPAQRHWGWGLHLAAFLIKHLGSKWFFMDECYFVPSVERFQKVKWKINSGGKTSNPALIKASYGRTDQMERMLTGSAGKRLQMRDFQGKGINTGINQFRMDADSETFSAKH